MTPFASVALFKRNGSVVFKPPRKETPPDTTQARKAAIRFWRGRATNGDKLVKVFVVRELGGRLEVSERDDATRGNWRRFVMDFAAASREAHLEAAMSEVGMNADSAPPTVPDVLVINGFTYRRDI